MENKHLTRRDFLKLGGVLLGLTTSGCIPRPIREVIGELSGKTELTPIDPNKETDVKIKLGEEKTVDLPLVAWVPDTRTSYLRDPNGNLRYFVAAGTDGFVYEGPSVDDLSNPKMVISPKREILKYGYNGYRAPGTVMRGSARGLVWSFDHIEEWVSEHDGSNFTARIALSKSTDDGQTFSDSGVILDGVFLQKPGDTVTGCGQPCAIPKNDGGVDYIYLYYTEWSKDKHYIGVARAPVGQIDNPDAWRKYHKGHFETSGQGGGSTPVIEAPPGEVYAALVSVSWNEYLKKPIALFEGSTGFWLASSGNGVDWGNYQKIAEFPQAHDKKVQGSTWYSYPTLLSEHTDNQFITGKNGFLVYSRGIIGEPHYMVRREFNIE